MQQFATEGENPESIALSIRETALRLSLEWNGNFTDGVDDDDVIETARSFERYLKGEQPKAEG